MHIFEDPALFKTVGVTGVMFGILGVLIPSFAYRGRKGGKDIPFLITIFLSWEKSGGVPSGMGFQSWNDRLRHLHRDR